MVGDGFDPASQIGPLASREHFDRVSTYLDVGRTEGTVLTGGGRVGERGWFVERRSSPTRRPTPG